MSMCLAALVISLCNPMDCSLPGSSVHGILQARILEWAAMLSSMGSSNPGIKPTSLKSPALGGGLFTISATWEASKTKHVLLVCWWHNSFSPTNWPRRKHNHDPEENTTIRFNAKWQLPLEGEGMNRLGRAWGNFLRWWQYWITKLYAFVKTQWTYI